MSNMCKKSHRTILTAVVWLFDRYFGLSSPPPPSPPTLYPSFPPRVLTARLTVCELRRPVSSCGHCKVLEKSTDTMLPGKYCSYYYYYFFFCIHLFETELLVGDTSVWAQCRSQVACSYVWPVLLFATTQLILTRSGFESWWFPLTPSWASVLFVRLTLATACIWLGFVLPEILWPSVKGCALKPITRATLHAEH